jgi:hypothetical protein
MDKRSSLFSAVIDVGKKSFMSSTPKPLPETPTESHFHWLQVQKKDLASSVLPKGVSCILLFNNNSKIEKNLIFMHSRKIKLKSVKVSLKLNLKVGKNM